MNLDNVRILINSNNIAPASPKLLAELFAEMNSVQQAKFFNHLAYVSSKWDGCFAMQLQSITDEDGLTLAGRRVMQGIGEYSHWGLVPRIDSIGNGG